MTILLSPTDVLKQKTSRYRILLETINEQLKERFNGRSPVTITLPAKYTEDDIISVCADLQAVLWDTSYVYVAGHDKWEITATANSYLRPVLTPEVQYDVWVSKIASVIESKTPEINTKVSNGLATLQKIIIIEDRDIADLLSQDIIVSAIIHLFHIRGWTMTISGGAHPHHRTIRLVSNKFPVQCKPQNTIASQLTRILDESGNIDLTMDNP